MKYFWSKFPKFMSSRWRIIKIKLESPTLSPQPKVWNYICQIITCKKALNNFKNKLVSEASNRWLARKVTSDGTGLKRSRKDVPVDVCIYTQKRNEGEYSGREKGGGRTQWYFYFIFRGQSSRDTRARRFTSLDALNSYPSFCHNSSI